MPPSPALRYSPGRDLRGETHKRGRSFEGGILFKEKDEDLALFNEMQSKETDNFLLQSDDFEDTFSTKLRHFSDSKLGITIPARGESTSELLNVEGEKNDYDWLLTPPDTPLFPSLDDEPQPTSTARRGRPRSQPISMSRSSTMEKSCRSSRGSASPNRLSPSPRSGNSEFQSRSRPSSASRTSPSPSMRSATPTRRPSPPPSKISASAPRSSTPSSRRSVGVITSGSRGTSPVRTARGNSASPKISSWQSNIPGFSLDAPPNLRTSLADRPASYVRGSSPASRNGRGRQSMSPTPSRSVCSSQSHDRDRFSSQSKGSVASYGDDEVDSIQSVSVAGSNFSASRKIGTFQNNRAPTFNKKTVRALSPASAPKRSFDSALRIMDHRKGPPTNMFRPLLSSVPSSSFYVGKGNTAYRSLVSRNSSLTTSSNASSDRGASYYLDMEGSDLPQDDLMSNYEMGHSVDVQEVFAFDEVDALNQDAGHGKQDSSHHIPVDEIDGDPAIGCDPGYSEGFSHHGIEMKMDTSSDVLCDWGNVLEVDTFNDTDVCSRCGCQYRLSEPVEEDTGLCPDCSKQNHILPVTPTEAAILATESSEVLPSRLFEESRSLYQLEPSGAVTDLQSQVTDVGEPRVSQNEEDAKELKNYSEETALARSLIEGDEQRPSNQQEMDKHIEDHLLTDRDSGVQQFRLCNDPAESKGDHSLLDRDTRDQQLCNNSPESKVNTSEVAGIPLLLKRSSGTKGPIIQGRAFTASSLPYEDLSYTRDSSSSWKSSIGFGSASASSSMDFSSSRQTETRVQRQLSGKKFDMENNRYDINAKPRSFGSLSRSSSNAHQASGSVASTQEILELNINSLKTYDAEESPEVSEAKVVASENVEADVIDSSTTSAVAAEKIVLERDESNRITDPSISELSGTVLNSQLEDDSAILHPNDKDHIPYEDEQDVPENAESDSGCYASAVIPESFIEEPETVNAGIDAMDATEDPAQSSLAIISEMETENHSQSSTSSEVGSVSPNSERNNNDLVEIPVPNPSDVDITTSEEKANTPNHTNRVLEEESTVLVDCQGGTKTRSLTLDEATDTILFCSSIVHDLAYQAAATAIEKENSMPLEELRPTVMVFGKSNTDRKEPRGRSVGRRASKSLKAKQRKVETDKKSAPTKLENDENANDYSSMRNVGVPNKEDSRVPPNLESKCNCSIM